MSKMDDMTKEIINTPDIKSDEFQEAYLDQQIQAVGLVYCCSCQRFVDDEQHNIYHVFALAWTNWITGFMPAGFVRNYFRIMI